MGAGGAVTATAPRRTNSLTTTVRRRTGATDGGRIVTMRTEQAPESATDASSMVTVSHLWKVFGVGRTDHALALSESGADRARILDETGQTIGVRDVSFDVGRGETFVVMGLSGSGKSTLIRCISRLVEPTRGSVVIDGDDVLAMNDEQLRAMRRTKMSMVFQHFGLFPHRRVIDNVAYGLEVQGIGKAERRARAGVVLEIVGLSAWASHYPQQLSGRHAATGRAGAGAGARPAGAVLRRAVLGPRSADPSRHAGRTARAAGHDAPHDRVHHPRLRRGVAPR